MKKLVAVLAVTALAAFGLAACGGDDDDDGGDTTAAQTAPTETAAGGAGAVTINYENPQSISHDVVIEDSAGEVLGETELISAGNTSTTVELQPGTYTFFCDVPGHREGGMEGTLTVK